MLPARGRSTLVVVHDSLFFFFSSRRRHTRLQGDWSSDVCSSDLVGFPGSPRVIGDGFDADGNEVLSYIDGEFVHPRAWSDEGIASLGALLRRLHEDRKSVV